MKLSVTHWDQVVSTDENWKSFQFTLSIIQKVVGQYDIEDSLPVVSWSDVSKPVRYKSWC